MILSAQSAEAGFFDDLLSNSQTIIGDVLKEKDPFSKNKDENGEDKEPTTVGERKVYKDVTITDLFETAQEAYKASSVILSGKLDKIADLLAGILGGDTTSTDNDKNRTILSDENRVEDIDLPDGLNKENQTSGDGSSVDKLVLQKPNSAEAIAQNTERINATLAQTPRLMQKIVLGDDGQQLIEDQEVLSQSSLETSSGAIDTFAGLGEQSGESAQFTEVLAKEAQGLANQAQGRKASQDVLKDSAAIAAKNSFSLSAIADQGVNQAVAMTTMGQQLDAINQQGSIENQKLTTLQLLSASQSDQLGQILSVDMSRQQSEAFASIEPYKAAYQSNGLYLVPGLGSYEGSQ